MAGKTRKPRKTDRSRTNGKAPPQEATPADEPLLEGAPETTGRYVAVFREGAASSALAALSKQVGLKHVCRASDFESGAIDIAQAESADVVYFDQIDAAVLSTPADEGLAMLSADESGPILAMEPEQVMYALSFYPVLGGASGAEYLRGYRDAVNHLSTGLVGPVAPELGEEEAEVGVAAFADTAQATWGLHATGALASRYTGRGIRVAVLDTGLDLQHPDFARRRITHRSFIQGQTAQDGHGHGTHCTGTACGPRGVHGGRPAHGCAPGAEIFIGKVLSNGGSGADEGILAGINWAVANRCQVISMSLGAPVAPGTPPSRVYEAVAQRVLAAGSLIVAAAGNESRRPFQIAPVGRPANCPSIMAVAALDSSLGVAPFSNGGLNPNGGGVDIAGPGVAVLSSVPRPQLHRAFQGTSMATPHVAGIAALFAESNRNLRGRALWQALVGAARRLRLPSRDVGAGLVKAA